MTQRGCDHFCEEVELIINRMRQEYEMTYAEVIGCLEVIKMGLMNEALDQDEGE